MGFGPFFLKSGQGNVPGRPLRSAGGSEPLQHSYSAERLSLGIGLESGMRLSRPIAREALLFFCLGANVACLCRVARHCFSALKSVLCANNEHNSVCDVSFPILHLRDAAVLKSALQNFSQSRSLISHYEIQACCSAANFLNMRNQFSYCEIIK